MAAYRLLVTPDDNKTFLVRCPALPEVVTFGDDEAAAGRWGLMAVEEAIAARMKAGVEIPPDTNADEHAGSGLTVHTPLLMDLKVDLYRALRVAGVTRADLARRLGWNRNSVDRLFDVNHASRLEQIEAAMGALGFRVDARLVAMEAA